jgi:hypothetical protein
MMKQLVRSIIVTITLIINSAHTMEKTIVTTDDQTTFDKEVTAQLYSKAQSIVAAIQEKTIKKTLDIELLDLIIELQESEITAHEMGNLSFFNPPQESFTTKLFKNKPFEKDYIATLFLHIDLYLEQNKRIKNKTPLLKEYEDYLQNMNTLNILHAAAKTGNDLSVTLNVKKMDSTKPPFIQLPPMINFLGITHLFDDVKRMCSKNSSEITNFATAVYYLHVPIDELPSTTA